MPQAEESREIRRRSALVVTSIELVLSLVGFALGLDAYLKTTNLRAGAYWSHACAFLASFLFLIGLALRHNGKGWILSGFVFAAIGILLLFVGAIVDGVQAGHVAGTEFSRCYYSSKSGNALCGNTFNIFSLWKSSCTTAFTKNTCFCCYLYFDKACSNNFWERTTSSITHYEGVDSCDQVEYEYKSLLWASMACNLINLIITIIVCALVGHYKSSLPVVSPAPIVIRQQQSRYQPAVIGATQGPVIIYAQQQTVGYYPQPILKPPDYDVPSFPPPDIYANEMVHQNLYYSQPRPDQQHSNPVSSITQPPQTEPPGGNRHTDVIASCPPPPPPDGTYSTRCDSAPPPYAP